MKFQRFLNVGLVLLIIANCASSEAQEQAQRNRQQFLEVMRIARLPVEEQKAYVARLYQLVPSIREIDGGMFSGGIFTRAPLPKDADEMTPEQLADNITKGFGHQYLGPEAKAVGRDLLCAHRESVTPLLKADFQDGRPNHVTRALDILEQMGRGGFREQIVGRKDSDPALQQWFKPFYEDVLQIFQSDSRLSQRAAGMFRYLGEPRAIDALIERDPQQPVRYYEQLANLSYLAPPHPKLVALLDSPDPEIRRRALTALRDRGELLPQLRKLLNDTNPRIRWMVANSIFNLGDEILAANRPAIIALLADPDAFVRHVVASRFAERKETIAAPVLLALLKDTAVSPSVRWAVIQDVRKLTGTDFGYVDSPDKQFVQKNSAALEKFQQWIDTHAGTVQPAS